MPIGATKPFAEALKHNSGRIIMPTRLTTAELRQLSNSERNQAFYSAQTLLDDLLSRYQSQIETILNPQPGERGATEGLDYATARMQIKELLRDLGYNAEEGKQGTIEDLSSDGRINLVLETNVQLAQGVGHFIQSNSPAVVDAFPCWEFKRFEDRKEPRNWPQRWKIACETAGDAKSLAVLNRTGWMIARKDSGVWQALGDGAGGYTDTLGNPFPPFAFRSGMWVQDVDRDTCIELGLIEKDDQVEPQKLDFTDAFGTSELEKAA